uniref:MARVEL domain-containing protein n=1 Tax=Parastrongyloides trichosuri TaxID=131310 RepID=A0A0N4ZMA4_PARTI
MVLDSSVLGPIKIIPARAYKKAQQQYIQHAYTNNIDQLERNNIEKKSIDNKNIAKDNDIINNSSDFKNINNTDNIPINLKYYMSNIYDHGYNSQYQQQRIPHSGGPYGQSAYLENQYGSAYYNQGYSHDYGGAYSLNPDIVASTSYRAFPQPSPTTGGVNQENGTLLHPYRRSRTAPVRTLPRQTPIHNSTYNLYPTAQRNGTHIRGQSADPPIITNYKYVPNYGPAFNTSQGKPKKRLSNSMSNPQYTTNQGARNPSGIKYTQDPIEYLQPKTPSGNNFYYNNTGPVSPGATSAAPYNPLSPNNPTLRRVTPYYTNYHTTHTATMYPGNYGGQQIYQNHHHQQQQQQYPTSVYGGTIYDRKRDPKAVSKTYPLFVRIIIKIFELILGAAILGLVIGPSTGYSFHDFVIMTKTEWQGAVVGIVAVFAICTLCLLLTICLANKQYFWRQFDVAISGIATLLYLVASFLEAYFAACYPPYGRQIDIVCHRAEWIVADILCFFNLVIYIVDLILALRTGVNIL